MSPFYEFRFQHEVREQHAKKEVVVEGSFLRITSAMRGGISHQLS